MKKYTVVRDYAKLYHKQAGMTLIELSVVLLILVGLAGLLIPYVSGFVSKTHDSTSVSTIAELNNTIQRYQTTKLSLPNNLENLYDTGSAQIYTKLQTQDYVDVLTAASGLHLANASLSKAGVTTVLYNYNLTDDATFKSTSGSATLTPLASAAADIPLVALKGNTAIALAGGDQTFFGQLSSSLVDNTNLVKNQLMYAFGGTQDSWDTACTNYVVMGIGSANSLIPSAMQAAPVHFSGTAGEAPATVYDRFVAVFAVPNGGTTSNAANVTCMKPDAAAKFVGTAAIMDFPALVGLNGAQQWANANLTKDN